MKTQKRKESTMENGHLQNPDPGSENKDGFKLLIAFASQYGSTGEVAEAIGDVVCQQGCAVDVKWVRDVEQVDTYDAVIVGSAIQYDKWMPEAVDFVRTNQKALSRVQVAYFFTCLTLAKKNPKTEQQALVYADRLRAISSQVVPVSVQGFAGVVDFSKMSFLSRMMLKAITTVNGVREGDYRDWDAIRAWAHSVYFKLSNEASIHPPIELSMADWNPLIL